MDHILYNILEAVFFVLWELIWLKFDLSWEQNGIKGDPERLRKEREELVLQKKKGWCTCLVVYILEQANILKFCCFSGSFLQEQFFFTYMFF